MTCIHRWGQLLYTEELGVVIEHSTSVCWLAGAKVRSSVPHVATILFGHRYSQKIIWMVYGCCFTKYIDKIIKLYTKCRGGEIKTLRFYPLMLKWNCSNVMSTGSNILVVKNLVCFQFSLICLNICIYCRRLYYNMF